MMKILLQIEQAFNRFFRWLLTLIKKVAQKITPSFLQAKIAIGFNVLVTFVNVVTSKLSFLKNLFFDRCKQFIHNQQESGPSKIQPYIVKVQKFFFKVFTKEGFFFYLDQLKAYIRKLYRALEIKLSKMSRTQSVVALLFFLALLSGLMYELNQKPKSWDEEYSEIHHRQRSTDRAPASSSQMSRKLPDYYNYYSKVARIDQLKIPTYIEETGDLKNLDVELSIKFTNRTAQMFFDKYEHLFYDQLQIMLEPVVPSFPLTDEGKEIIRKKIEDELNTVLINENVDGRVENIKITYILAN